MDDDIDIYGDLVNFEENSNENYRAENLRLTEKCSEMEKIMSEMTESFGKIQKEKNILEINLSALLKTAKTEITRKDRMIVELREKIENATFRRGNFRIPKRNGQSNDIKAAKPRRRHSEDDIINSGKRLDRIKEERHSHVDPNEKKSKIEAQKISETLQNGEKPLERKATIVRPKMKEKDPDDLDSIEEYEEEVNDEDDREQIYEPDKVSTTVFGERLQKRLQQQMLDEAAADRSRKKLEKLMETETEDVSMKKTESEIEIRKDNTKNKADEVPKKEEDDKKNSYRLIPLDLKNEQKRGVGRTANTNLPPGDKNVNNKRPRHDSHNSQDEKRRKVDENFNKEEKADKSHGTENSKTNLDDMEYCCPTKVNHLDVPRRSTRVSQAREDRVVDRNRKGWWEDKGSRNMNKNRYRRDMKSSQPSTKYSTSRSRSPDRKYEESTHNRRTDRESKKSSGREERQSREKTVNRGNEKLNEREIHRSRESEKIQSMEREKAESAEKYKAESKKSSKEHVEERGGSGLKEREENRFIEKEELRSKEKDKNRLTEKEENKNKEKNRTTEKDENGSKDKEKNRSTEKEEYKSKEKNRTTEKEENESKERDKNRLTEKEEKSRSTEKEEKSRSSEKEENKFKEKNRSSKKEENRFEEKEKNRSIEKERSSRERSEGKSRDRRKYKSEEKETEKVVQKYTRYEKGTSKERRDDEYKDAQESRSEEKEKIRIQPKPCDKYPEVNKCEDLRLRLRSRRRMNESNINTHNNKRDSSPRYQNRRSRDNEMIKKNEESIFSKETAVEDKKKIVHQDSIMLDPVVLEANDVLPADVVDNVADILSSLEEGEIVDTPPDSPIRNMSSSKNTSLNDSVKEEKIENIEKFIQNSLSDVKKPDKLFHHVDREENDVIRDISEDSKIDKMKMDQILLSLISPNPHIDDIPVVSEPQNKIVENLIDSQGSCNLFGINAIEDFKDHVLQGNILDNNIDDICRDIHSLESNTSISHHEKLEVGKVRSMWSPETSLDSRNLDSFNNLRSSEGLGVKTTREGTNNFLYTNFQDVEETDFLNFSGPSNTEDALEVPSMILDKSQIEITPVTISNDTKPTGKQETGKRENAEAPPKKESKVKENVVPEEKTMIVVRRRRGPVRLSDSSISMTVVHSAQTTSPCQVNKSKLSASNKKKIQNEQKTD